MIHARRRIGARNCLTARGQRKPFCSHTGDDGDDEEGPITIGAIQLFSGPFAEWGSAHSKGLNFAIDEINDDGGVLGRDLALVETDTGSDPVEADNIFRQHVEEEGAVASPGT